MNDPIHPEEAIFEAALALPASNRAAYLDRTCGGNAGLRQLVEDLLEANEAAGGFLEEPAPGAEPSPAAGPQSPRAGSEIVSVSVEKPGDRIGRYKLLQQIGEGGCGVVYMAEQEEPVRRKVALKVIKLGMDTRQVIARFEAERQALALMDHPNIAKVLDAGATETGRPYFVMELVRGIKITDYCDQNNLPTRQRLGLFIQVCQAIQHAHQKGVIHRDIKPSNILVTLRDGVPVPKVIDFGIAKATTDQRLTDKTLFTAFQQFIGTPAYMSPEQAEMSELGIDTRSDIYSLGVLLYELLTSQTPFDAKELLQAGLDAMRRIIREQEPARPSTKLSTILEAERTSVANHRQTDAPKLVNLLRGDLDWIVLKSLEKDRARRYETANGLAMDVQRYLNDEPIVASPPSGFYRFKKLLRRNKLAFIAASMLASLLLIGVGAGMVAAVRIARDNQKIKIANATATEKLWSAYLSEARARRASGRTGQRFASLEAVAKAAAIRPSLEVRNEAIASLALCDVRVVRHAKFRLTGPEQKLRFDPRLEQYAVEAGRGDVSIHRVEDDRETALLLGGDSTLNAILGFSADGRLLAVNYQTTSTGDNMWVWDLARKEAILKQPSGATAFSPDSQLFALARPEGGISVYTLDSTNVTRRLAVNQRFTGLNFGPGGTKLACVREGNRVIEIRDARTGEMAQTLVLPVFASSMAWSADGRLMAFGATDWRVYVWSVEDAQMHGIMEGHTDNVIAVGFNPTGDLLASSSWDGTQKLWNPDTGHQVLSSPGGGLQAQFSPDGKRLTFQDGLASFGIMEVAHSHEFQRLYVPHAGRELSGPEFSRDGRVVAAETGGGVHFWDADSAKELASLLPIATWDTLIFHPGGRSLITSERSGGIYWRSWQAKPNAGEYTLAKPRLLYADTGLREAAITVDGRFLAVANFDKGEGVVFDVENPSSKVLLRGHSQMDKIAISPDGRWAATASWHNSEVKIWNAKSGELVRTLSLPARAIVAFSPDGRWLLTGSTEYQLWQVGSWQKKNPAIPGQLVANFNCLAFSADSRLMAIVTQDPGIQLVETLTGQTLATLEAPDSSRPLAFHFSPDGTRLASLETSQQIQLWDLRLIRDGLQKLNLDLDLPPFPPAEKIGVRITVEVEAEAGPLADRAAFLASSGKWKEAAIAAAKALELQPADHLLYHSLAPLLVASGEVVGYRQLCQRILARFGGTYGVFKPGRLDLDSTGSDTGRAQVDDPAVAERMAKDCLILPDAVADLLTVSQMAQLAVTAGSSNRFLPYFQCTKGLAEYRQEHFTSAIDWMQKTLANARGNGGRAWDDYLYVEAYSVLAMAHFRLKESDQALVSLAKAGAAAEKNLPPLENGEIGEIWRDWIIAHTLLNEARALIEGATPASQAR